MIAHARPQRRDLRLVDEAVARAHERLQRQDVRSINGRMAQGRLDALEDLAAWERIQATVQAAYLARV